MVIVGGIFLFTGYISSIFVTRVEHLFLTYGLVLGLGCSMCWSTSISHLGFYFKERRALANGLALSGVGLGNLILPPVMTYLLELYGLSGTLLVFAGLSLNVCVAGALLRPISAYTRGRKKSLSPSKTESHGCSLRDLLGVITTLEWSLLKRPRFLLYGMALYFYMSGYPTFFVILPPHAEQEGYSSVKIGYIVSLTGLAELLGRLIAGLCSDFHIIRTRIIIISGLLLGSLTSALTPTASSYISLSVIGFIYTLGTAPVMAMIPVLMVETVGMYFILFTKQSILHVFNQS